MGGLAFTSTNQSKPVRGSQIWLEPRKRLWIDSCFLSITTWVKAHSLPWKFCHMHSIPLSVSNNCGWQWVALLSPFTFYLLSHHIIQILIGGSSYLVRAKSDRCFWSIITFLIQKNVAWECCHICSMTLQSLQQLWLIMGGLTFTSTNQSKPVRGASDLAWANDQWNGHGLMGASGA